MILSDALGFDLAFSYEETIVLLKENKFNLVSFGLRNNNISVVEIKESNFDFSAKSNSANYNSFFFVKVDGFANWKI